MATSSSRKSSMRKYDGLLVVGGTVAVILTATFIILVVLIWRKYLKGGKNAFKNLAHMRVFLFFTHSATLKCMTTCNVFTYFWQENLAVKRTNFSMKLTT
jgi:hypothetical protein